MACFRGLHKVSSLGLIIGTLSSFLFTVAAFFVTLIPNTNPFLIFALRSGTQLMVYTPLLIIKREPFLGVFGERIPLFIFSFSSALGSSLGYFCISYLPFSEAIVLISLSPVFVTFLSFAIHKEKIGFLEISVILCTICGVTFISRPKFIFQDDLEQKETKRLAGTLLGLTSSLLQGVMYYSFRYLKKTPVTVLNVHFSLHGVVLCGLLLMAMTDFNMYSCGWNTAYMFLCGLAGVIATQLFTEASKLETPAYLSVVFNLSVVFSLIFQLVGQNVYAPWTSYFGTVLVLGSILLIAYRNWKNEIPRLQRAGKILLRRETRGKNINSKVTIGYKDECV